MPQDGGNGLASLVRLEHTCMLSIILCEPWLALDKLLALHPWPQVAGLVMHGRPHASQNDHHAIEWLICSLIVIALMTASSATALIQAAHGRVCGSMLMQQSDRLCVCGRQDKQQASTGTAEHIMILWHP